MILIIGGACQGKLACALDHTGLTEADVSHDPGLPRPIIHGLESWLKTAEDPWPTLDALLDAQPDVIIICDEVGSGVVPMDPGERAWRERVGRTCCTLAQRARAVVRVYCGIPTTLKGTNPWN